MSSKAYFPVSIPDLKRDLLSNTHSFRIRLKGREFKVFPTNEISSSRDQLRARCRSSDYVKDRVLLYILLEGRTFDVKNCHEELTYWEISMDHSLQTELGALIQLSTLLIYFQDRKLDVTRAIDESWGFCPQTSPHIFPLERQLLFQIMYKGRMFDVTLPPPPPEPGLPLDLRLKRLVETISETRHENGRSFSRNDTLNLQTAPPPFPADTTRHHQNKLDHESSWNDPTRNMPNHVPQFVYKPIEHKDSIRLLFLEACSMTDAPIKCTIIHSRLSHNPQYHALSYEWGPEDNDHDPFIFINRDQHLRVRRNLYSALMEIRASDTWSSNQALWIDAICINQRNCHSEKPHQVRLMGSIYRQAARVVAWLGVARDDSDIGMDVLNTYSHHMCRAHLLRRASCTWCRELCSTASSLIDKLWERSYWRRVWIIQELQLSRSLVLRYGSKSITAENLERAIESLECFEKPGFNQRTWKGEEGLHLYTPYKHLASRKHGYRALAKLLRICIDDDFKAYEPRDYVYALLAICTDRRIDTIVVDYDKSLNLVYKEALVVMREGMISDTWCSPSGSYLGPAMCDLVRGFADKMGIKFDWQRDIIETDLLVKESIGGEYWDNSFWSQKSVGLLGKDAWTTLLWERTRPNIGLL